MCNKMCSFRRAKKEAGDRLASCLERSISRWPEACDRGCSGETGWGRADRASGCVVGNDRHTGPYHSLGCVSSTYGVSLETR